MSAEITISANTADTILQAGSPNDEFIVEVEFNYCDVNYSGYRIMERSEIARLCEALGSGKEIGTPNMPGHWYEEFDISELEGAFRIHSNEEDDIEAMRNLFGEEVGNTDLFHYALECASDDISDASEDDENDQIAVSHIDLGTAQKFLEDPDLYDLSQATSLDDDAAELLSKHSGDLFLDGLEKISPSAATAFSKHVGDILSLNGLNEISLSTAEALSDHEGGIALGLRGLTNISDPVADALSYHPGILDLEGLNELSDSAAESLSKQTGLLILSGLTELSDAAADFLSQHQGDIDLGGLQQISDTTAEILAKKEGTICRMEPAEWVESLRANQE